MITYARIRITADIRLSIARAGSREGPAILLLHGWPQTNYAWRKVIPLLADRGFDVLAPDLRGFGASSKPEGVYSKLTVAGDLIALLDELGVETAWVVGHDLGGQVAYPFAANWPERTRGLVFIESGLPGFGQERAMDVAQGGSWHFGFNRAGEIAEELVRGREAIFIRAMIHREKVGVYDPTAVTDDDIGVYARAAAAPGCWRAMAAHYRALIPQDLDDNIRLGRTPLTCPVLAVGADHGYRRGAFETMTKVAIAPTGWIASACGHYVPEERPCEFVEALAAFIAEKS